MAVLITGGAGYIGSHTCVEMLGAGHAIVLLDNFSNAKPEAVDRIKALSGKDFPVYATDILDEAGLREVFAREGIDAVVHFAGYKAVGESVQVPLDYYRNNVGGAISLVRAMAQAGCKRLVFSSSATVYGDSQDVPFKEGHPTAATNPYGMTKLIIERILQDAAAADPAWSIALLRYFNPIGAHPSGLLGDEPKGIPNNLMPYIAQVAAGKLDCLSVFGDDYDTKDGTGVRDYLHVSDLAIGHLKALAYIQANRGVEAINLGSGTGFTVMEVIHAFEQATGIAIKHRIAERRPGDIAQSYADTAKAQELLQWKAERTLHAMCADAWHYVSKYYESAGGA